MRTWLRELRKNKNFTMAEVARKSNISEGYYSMIESGQRDVPVNTAKKIAKALDFEWILFFSEETA